MEEEPLLRPERGKINEALIILDGGGVRLSFQPENLTSNHLSAYLG